ncbi:MAG: cytochrome bd-I oxidase subunit CydX [Alcaligenaceae bacterium]|jgi:cyd operon protein YbgT|nr:cytochrome bd-I oxidase subunit CydX [Alcaligenaceae bacterium]
MWYLTWMLGTAFACGAAIAAGLWYELHQQRMDGSTETVKK